ncbi:MAG TPA: 5-nitroimidazole antibiotic resistance protein [Clostridiales bacterium]|nr:5-nitroimidazole antibiotic resistance protein [Clostridiales bacterium]
MRRKDRQKDKDFALNVVRECEYATLATLNNDNTPYCIPISPVLYDDVIYFHCATEGKKLDNIIKNSNVCLSCVRNIKLVPKDFITKFESAVVFGKCFIINDPDEKLFALKEICEKYAKENIAEFENAVSKWMSQTTICKIIIDEITGKANE